MKRAWWLVVLCFCGILSAQEVRRALPVTAGPDADLAAFLAGRPVGPGSPLERLQESRAYARHQQEMHALWGHYNGRYFEPMRLWSAAELSSRIAMNRPLTYFFGGPDAVSALGLFPDAPVYLLSGLEPVGEIAPPQSLATRELEASLATLRVSVKTILSFGHFITKDMKHDLESSSFRGALPVLFTFVSLTGGEILSCSYFSINKEGVAADTGNRLPTQGIPGVRILFRRSSVFPPQTLIYTQANVANGSLGADPALFRWVASFGRGNAWLKAASYLLHESEFSRMRAFLLAQSDAILQDDSGVPMQAFLDGSWRLWFFGAYSGVLDIFQKYYQQKMADAFAAPPGPLPLPFGTGYKWRLGESHLLLAVRSEPPRALPTAPEPASMPAPMLTPAESGLPTILLRP